MLGTVKWFNAIKGFGFIEVKGNIRDIFLHKTSLCKGLKTVEAGDLIQFDVTESAKGKVAQNVRVIA